MDLEGFGQITKLIRILDSGYWILDKKENNYESLESLMSYEKLKIRQMSVELYNNLHESSIILEKKSINLFNNFKKNTRI